MLDPMLARARLAEQQARWAEKRKKLLAKALWAALHQRDKLRPRLAGNLGVWWPEMQPLGPTERTAMLVQLREAWGLPPDPRMKPAEGRPKLDAPHMGRPE
jgi:hypothetical protein